MSKLFSKENGEVFSSPLNLNNPIAVQVLGICSALAVTSQWSRHCHGAFGNSDYGFFQSDYIFDT